MGQSDWVHLDVEEVLRESDKALLVRLEDGREEWLPFSQISEPDDYKVGDRNVTISITSWLANQKGLDDG